MIFTHRTIQLVLTVATVLVTGVASSVWFTRNRSAPRHTESNDRLETRNAATENDASQVAVLSNSESRPQADPATPNQATAVVVSEAKAAQNRQVDVEALRRDWMNEVAREEEKKALEGERLASVAKSATTELSRLEAGRKIRLHLVNGLGSLADDPQRIGMLLAEKRKLVDQIDQEHSDAVREGHSELAQFYESKRSSVAATAEMVRKSLQELASDKEISNLLTRQRQSLEQWQIMWLTASAAEQRATRNALRDAIAVLNEPTFCLKDGDAKSSERILRVLRGLGDAPLDAIWKSVDPSSRDGEIDAYSGNEALNILLGREDSSAGKVNPPKAVDLASDSSLISSIPVKKHAISGEWRSSSAGFQNNSHGSAIELPIDVDNSYEISMQVVRTKGNDAIILVLPVGSGNVKLAIDANHGAFHYLDRKQVKGKQLVNGRSTDIAIRLLANGEKCDIQFFMDKALMANWRGPIRLLNELGGQSPPNRGRIAIYTTEATFRISSVRYKKAD